MLVLFVAPHTTAQPPSWARTSHELSLSLGHITQGASHHAPRGKRKKTHARAQDENVVFLTRKKKKESWTTRARSHDRASDRQGEAQKKGGRKQRKVRGGGLGKPRKKQGFFLGASPMSVRGEKSDRAV